MKKKISCSGKIIYPGGSATFEAARRSDIAQLARIYRGIAVTKENYRQKFDFARADSFSGAGGMFQIHNESSLRAAMKRSFFLVVRSGGRIVSSFWGSFSDPDFLGFRPDSRAFAGREGMYRSLCGALERGRVAYARELIVLQDSGVPSLAHLMFYLLFRAISQRGYTHSLGVVYRVCGYADKEGAHKLTMLNERSFGATASTGALRLGPLPRRTIRLDGLSVLIEPEAFDFDYDTVLPFLQDRLAGRGIAVGFDGEEQL